MAQPSRRPRPAHGAAISSRIVIQVKSIVRTPTGDLVLTIEPGERLSLAPITADAARTNQGVRTERTEEIEIGSRSPHDQRGQPRVFANSRRRGSRETGGGLSLTRLVRADRGLAGDATCLACGVRLLSRRSPEHHGPRREQPLPIPVLALGTEHGVGGTISKALGPHCAALQGGVLAGSGHFIPRGSTCRARHGGRDDTQEGEIPQVPNRILTHVFTVRTRPSRYGSSGRS